MAVLGWHGLNINADRFLPWINSHLSIHFDFFFLLEEIKLVLIEARIVLRPSAHQLANSSLFFLQLFLLQALLYLHIGLSFLVSKQLLLPLLLQVINLLLLLVLYDLRKYCVLFFYLNSLHRSLRLVHHLNHDAIFLLHLLLPLQLNELWIGLLLSLWTLTFRRHFLKLFPSIFIVLFLVLF